MIFTNELGYIQSIKQFADAPLSVGCTIYLSICLYIRFEALTDNLRVWAVHAVRLFTWQVTMCTRVILKQCNKKLDVCTFLQVKIAHMS